MSKLFKLSPWYCTKIWNMMDSRGSQTCSVFCMFNLQQLSPGWRRWMMQQAQKRVNSSATGDWTVKTETQMFRAVYDQSSWQVQFLILLLLHPSFCRPQAQIICIPQQPNLKAHLVYTNMLFSTEAKISGWFYQT